MLYNKIDEANCDSLKVGDSLISVNNGDDSRLTRVSDKKFKIQINPIFSPAADQQKYANLMNECFKKYAPLLKGPDNEMVEIEAIDDKSISPVHISIQNHDFRTHSKSYANNIKCPTVLHETLHLLGLVDEYQEESMGYNIDHVTGEKKFVLNDAEIVGYNCRVIGPKISIMNDEFAAVRSAMPTREAPLTTCICVKSKNDCQKLIVKNIRTILANKCPEGFDEQTTPILATEDEIKDYSLQSMTDFNVVYRKLQNEDGKMEYGQTEFNLIPNFKNPKVNMPKRDTLLFPAQFRMIAHPECMSQNSRYLECAKSAYLSNKVNGACGTEAVKCQSDKYWLQ